MGNPVKYLLILCFLVFVCQISDAVARNGQRVKTKVYLSPKIELRPGEVSNKVYTNIEFPKGHIAIKSFDAELVDEKGRPVPLYDTYLHHWIVIRYHQEIKNQSNLVSVENSGLCSSDSGLRQYFGLGSETRRTLNAIPDPYGVVVGNPAQVPQGFQEGWLLNVHAIDTRNAVDKRGCLECTCNLYSNITLPAPLPGNYSGGLRCCTDGSRCKLKDGSKGVKKTIYLKYTVKYVDWDTSVVPVRIYVLDATDPWKKGNASSDHNCQIEYDVPACPHRKQDGTCIDTRTVKLDFDKGGDVIYAVGHLHVGGTAIALYGQSGNEICTSYPIYGTGKKAGNEAGYVVGMSTCYPRPGSVKIYPGETVTLVSHYSNVQGHTGVMSLIYLLVADSSA